MNDLIKYNEELKE